ncbi:MAG: hypothetical protein IT440_15325 [Phycisphaeraceae bacterium]|nr:hypothetical protein [Phycisphaeraceae bacterium]
MKQSILQVGQTRLETVIRDGWFLGLGRISVQGVELRSGQVPMRPRITTPDGICYHAFRLDDVRTERNATILVTTAFGRQEMFGQYRDEYDSILAWPAADDGACEDVVEWRLVPETLTLDDVTYEGFSYAIRFRSAKRSIHQMLMTATWELGGRATGNTLLYQGQVNPPVYVCRKNTDFTTACWRQLGQVGKPDNYSFQFSSRYSPLQCFDFQYGPSGSLLGYWPDLVDVHSLVQKNKREDVVFVLDKCLTPLSRKAAFPRKCILWASPTEGGVQQHTMHDRWLAALEFTQDRARASHAIQRPYILPDTSLMYRTSLSDKGKLVMWIAGKPHEPKDALDAWAKHFSTLADAGVRRVF